MQGFFKPNKCLQKAEKVILKYINGITLKNLTRRTSNSIMGLRVLLYGFLPNDFQLYQGSYAIGFSSQILCKYIFKFWKIIWQFEMTTDLKWILDFKISIKNYVHENET
jgi:hypothetical protein